MAENQQAVLKKMRAAKQTAVEIASLYVDSVVWAHLSEAERWAYLFSARHVMTEVHKMQFDERMHELNYQCKRLGDLYGS